MVFQTESFFRSCWLLDLLRYSLLVRNP